MRHIIYMLVDIIYVGVQCFMVEILVCCVGVPGCSLQKNPFGGACGFLLSSEWCIHRDFLDVVVCSRS